MAKSANVILQTRAAIYIRVSTQYQVDRASLPVQREELINYARYALNIESYEVFEDAGFSAKNTDRPAYQQMMSRVRTGEFSHILVWKIDRISRNLLDFAGMYAELKKLGVVFVSKNEQFDTSNAMGEAMLKIILVFAELERNMTSERVTAVMIARANDGIWNGGKIPFGYDYDKETKTFSVNETEAAVILMIYDIYEEEHSLLRTAQIMNEKGLLPRSGIPWNPTTIRTMLVNPFYAGIYRYNYHDEDSKTFSVKPESEWVIVENHHPAIVDLNRQKRVADDLSSRKRGTAGSGLVYNRGTVHLFAGLLRCDYCGSSMKASQDRSRRGGWRPSNYRCNRQRRFRDCPNKYISDVTLGPFVFNFIANMIRASNSFGKTTSIETLQKKLLRGYAFRDVDHIGQVGLEELYNHLRAGVGALEYTYDPPDKAESEAAVNEHDVLLSEKRRIERALNRLKQLYLFSDDSLPEKDYVIERKRLMDSLSDTEDRLYSIEHSVAYETNMSDDEFMAKASYFIMAQKLQDKRHINYETFIRQIDPQIPKDFLNSVIQNFCIRDGKIVSIRFKNGINLQFSYRPK